MRYSQNLVWKAVYVFCPMFETVKANGIAINLPTALREAAVVAFVEAPKPK